MLYQKKNKRSIVHTVLVEYLEIGGQNLFASILYITLEPLYLHETGMKQSQTLSVYVIFHAISICSVYRMRKRVRQHQKMQKPQFFHISKKKHIIINDSRLNFFLKRILIK